MFVHLVFLIVHNDSISCIYICSYNAFKVNQVQNRIIRGNWAFDVNRHCVPITYWKESWVTLEESCNFRLCSIEVKLKPSPVINDAHRQGDSAKRDLQGGGLAHNPTTTLYGNNLLPFERLFGHGAAETDGLPQNIGACSAFRVIENGGLTKKGAFWDQVKIIERCWVFLFQKYDMWIFLLEIVKYIC